MVPQMAIKEYAVHTECIADPPQSDLALTLQSHLLALLVWAFTQCETAYCSLLELS